MPFSTLASLPDFLVELLVGDGLVLVDLVALPMRAGLFSQREKLFFPFFPVVIYKRDFFRKTIRIEQMKNFL